MERQHASAQRCGHAVTQGLRRTSTAPGLALGLASVLAGFSCPPSAHAVVKPHDNPLPNLDVRVPAATAADAVAAQTQSLLVLRNRLPDLRVQRDPLLGMPRWVSRSHGFLSGPNGAGAAVSAAFAPGAAAAAADLHAPVKAFLNEHAALFGHNATALDSARVKRDDVTRHSGLRTVIWEQLLDGIPVYEGLIAGHMTRNGELVSISSRFVPNLADAAQSVGVNRASLVAAPGLLPAQAIASAAATLGGTLDGSTLLALAAPEGAEKAQRFTAPGLRGDARAQLVWLPLNRNTLRLCWRVELSPKGRQELYSLVIDAATGQVLIRRCLTAYLTDATYNVFTSDSPSPFSPGHPEPSRVQPKTVERQKIKISALSTNASPDGWINDGDRETVGNNVDAHTDRNDDDRPDLPRPNGGANRTFDFSLDLTKAPNTYTNASVTQLFYWNNWAHDRLYDLGFTEAAGNFQTTNFNRGGVGNDAVQADGQDGGGLNNANFATPPDGAPGRMQMYVFSGPTPDRDGDLDAEVILHEYVHGLSNRLVGGGIGIFELQPAGMGEGWSDFYGLALLSEAKDDVHGNYAAGGYLSYLLSGLEENYYFGIRRYPYSTSLSKNPLTFKDIDPSQASPHPGIPINPVFGGGPADEVHNMGEVWCVALWEARALLIDKLGFTEGNETILRLVTDGMKLAPPNPTYLEARDAILQADLVSTGGDSRSELWIAFAKRGMGFSAQAPPSFTAVGVVEAFDLPEDVVVTPPDGILDVSVNPPSGSVLFASSSEPMFVRVTDGRGITNANVTATVTGAPIVGFRNDGQTPDVTAANSVYSGTVLVPTNSTLIAITLNVTAPDKTAAQTFVYYQVVPLPVNDNFEGSIKVPANGTNYISNNRFATVQTGEPRHAGLLASAASLWWSYSSPVDTPILVDTAGSTFDTILAVYTNNTLLALKEVTSTNNVGDRKQAFVNFTARAGVPYRVAVASPNTNTTGSVRLNFLPNGFPDTNAPSIGISEPPSGITLTTNRVLLSGQAFDPQPYGSGVSQIQIRLEYRGAAGDAAPADSGLPGSRFEMAIPAGDVAVTNWSSTVALREGLNIIYVSATDVAGNKSVSSSVQVNYRALDPVNDLFSNAIVLDKLAGDSSVNTSNAEKENGEPLHAGNLGGRSAWWSFTAPQDGMLRLSTTNSLFDTLLAMYTGSRVSALDRVADNDDATTGSGFSRLSQAVRKGVRYSIAVDGYAGASGVAFLRYDFAETNILSLLVSNTPGGRVLPGSTLVVSNSTVVLSASAEAGFEFKGWIGDVASKQNPLPIVIKKDTQVTGVFGPRSYEADFETGDLSQLPFTTSGAVPWTVQGDVVSGGKFAARSGAIGHRQTSSLLLVTATRAGVGGFDYRVSSEQNWDFLEFFVNGQSTPLLRVSGDTSWARFQFNLAAGTNSLEWRYSKDAATSENLDAAFIDNVELPTTTPIDPTSPALLSLSLLQDGRANIRVQGQIGQTYVTEASTNFLGWVPISTNEALEGFFFIIDPAPLTIPMRFYRSLVP